jgi:anti-anti-sigma regulatory factor
VTSPQTIRLPMNASVRECAALKQLLLELVKSSDAVLIDVTDVEIVDTAILQLLFVFSRERNACDLSTIWQGNSPAFRNAATVLGLQHEF